MQTINKLVKQLKQENQDHLFYPSTDEIIQTVQASINKHFKARFHSDSDINSYSLLDCGSGDGRILNKLGHEHGDKYAIEKSTILINELSKDTYIIGTDFHETTLIDKQVDVIFCNPPYTEYEQWASKIIQEANGKHIYLVIPERWHKSIVINNALKLRNTEAKVIGSFDFLLADRAARANIDILHISLIDRYDSGYRDRVKSDPFDIWFDENFKVSNSKHEQTIEKEHKESVASNLARSGNLIKTLVDCYNTDMSGLSETFMAVSALNGSILKELNVDVNSIKKALKQRIKGLKNKYWTELFSNYDVINKKLTSKSLERMKKRLFNHTNVDFTESNCYAITGWVIKNANSYFDSQLIDVVESMVTEANTANYQSNHRVFKQENTYYSKHGENQNRVKDGNYKLDVRIVLEGNGGLSVSSYSFENDRNNGLSEYSKNTINDLIVVANNIGFTCIDRAEDKMWLNKNSQDFIIDNSDILMNVKAFKNGNLHIKFNQKFIRKLNVQFGRLKGWLKDKGQASEELNIPIDDIDFYSNLQLVSSDILILGVD